MRGERWVGGVGARGRRGRTVLGRWMRACGDFLNRILTERSSARSLRQTLAEGRPLARSAPDLRRIVERARPPLARLPEGGIVHRSGDRILVGPHWSKHRVRRYRVG